MRILLPLLLTLLLVGGSQQVGFATTEWSDPHVVSTETPARVKSEPLPRYLPSQGMGLGLFSPLHYPIGLQYDLMLGHRNSLQLGLGPLSMGFGVTHYLTDPRSRKFNYTIGLQASWLWESVDASIGSSGRALYLPLGIQYWGAHNFNYTLMLGPAWLENPAFFSYAPNQVPVFLGANVGYRFGYDVEEAKWPETTYYKRLVSGRVGLVNPFLGMVYEYLLTPFLAAEFAVGISGVTIGANVYYPALRPGRVSMKVGANTGVFWGIFFTERTQQLPIGMTYLARNRWLLGVEVGPQRFDDFELPFGISARIGRNF